MKKLLLAALLVFAAMNLTACTPGNNTAGSTILGAAGGGLLGGAIFGGSGAGIAAGALIGGGIGYAVGRHMDRQDHINMVSAVGDTPMNEEARWTNDRTHTTYVVRPIRRYRHDGRYCREFETRVKIGGRWRKAYGRACQMPDGSWRIVR